MNLIILTDSDRLDDAVYCLRDGRAEHIRSILKPKVGETVEVGLLNGPAGQGEIVKIGDAEVCLRCLEMTAVSEPGMEIDLICALPRPQTLKKVLFTASMMGVRRLHLVRANRVEKSYFHSPLLEPENLIKHVVEGLSQGKLTRAPEISIHDRFKRFFEDEFPQIEAGEAEPSHCLLPHPEVPQTLSDLSDSVSKRLVVAVGPEGGWVPFELELMQAGGFVPFSLGRWVLRVEHAVTAVMAQIELVYSRPNRP
jgi:RsmE family RNA methyltransferase